MTKGLAQVWSDWGIQILVLLSFTLQVMLLAFAGIRRRKSSAALRVLLWLMYLLADSTAIYTLGHLSVATSKKNAGDDDDQQQQQLVAFWAPFLLVHLGGPGSITAYSLEDNRLWLRHLLTLAIQVLGAAFVVYKYIAGGRRPLLLLAAMLVFFVGVLRYGERTWALWSANTSSIRSTLKYPAGEEQFNLSHWGKKLRWPCPKEDEDNSGVDDEQLLLGAHSLLHITKSMFVDATQYLSDFNRICTRWYGGKDVPRLAELEMSLMYDILYTKAAVVHTWCGYAILVVSPLATAAAFLLFHWSSSGSVSDEHGGSSKQLVNVGITYALLSGTLALETIAMVRAVGSTWACALMYCCGWNRLLGAVTALRRRVGAASKRRWWPGSMGQFNLLHLSTRDRAELGNKVASMLGLRSLWSKAHNSGTTTISTTDIKDRIQQSFGSKIDGTGNSRGVRVLETGLQGNVSSFARRTLTGAFDDSILVWHIATDVYLSETKVEHEEQLVAAVQVLSNYMMFLLVAQSEMLPGPIRQGQYLDTCNELDQVWDKSQGSLPAPGRTPAPPHRWMMSMLKKLFQPDIPNGASSSRMQQRKELATKLLGNVGNNERLIESGPVFFLTTRPSSEGPRVAAELLGMDSNSMLEMIFGVWAEMLCYAAHHCSRDSHARHLNDGGEFITVLWLWTQYQPLVG